MNEDCNYLDSSKEINSNYKELATLPTKNKIQVGYLFEKKKESFMCDCNVILSSKQFMYWPIIPYVPFASQGPFDLVIQKAMTLIKNGEQGKLIEFESKSPSTVFIDPVKSMLFTFSRDESNAVLDKILQGNQCKEIMAKFNMKIAVNTSRNVLPNDIKENEIYFVKPKASIGSADSHILSIVTSKKGLEDCLKYYKSDVIIENFIKHSGVLFKLYTIGKKVYYYQKQSIASNLPFKDYASFDSQKPFPKEWLNSNKVQDYKLNIDFVTQINEVLYLNIGISFLGLDIVIEEGTGTYYIIDLNYFTVIKLKNEEYMREFTNYLIEKVHSAKK
jgi:Inositol 1,3,4-trisphosphate 5/6-kinase ATP-grasp domain/Inositol 1,3,4-trisphosphate 5/6-kinase pre-ATP-grasp domain